MIRNKLSFVVLLVSALVMWGCGSSETGTGGSAGSGGTAGAGGVGGSGGVAITTGLYSSWSAGTSVCLFVHQDGTKLVADTGCLQSGSGPGHAFEFRTNRQDGICAFGYPVAGDDSQEVPIVGSQFQIEQTRTDASGEYTIRFSGEFNPNGGVSGMASSTRNCPMDQAWSAGLGCCSICDWCQ